MFWTEIYFQSVLFVLTRLHKGNNGNDDDDVENDLIEKIAPRILAPLTVSIWNNAYITDIEHPTSQLPRGTYQCFCNQKVVLRKSVFLYFSRFSWIMGVRSLGLSLLFTTWLSFLQDYSKCSALSNWGWIWSLELILTDLDSIYLVSSLYRYFQKHIPQCLIPLRSKWKFHS